jgi:hypothetical protein
MYIVWWQFPEKSDIEYCSSASPEQAATWEFREVAEVHVRDFNKVGVTIPCPSGGEAAIRNFMIERRSDGKFVMCCELPPMVQYNCA